VERHVVGQGGPVDRGVCTAAREQRRQCGGEPKPLGGLVEVERLDAEPVSAQDQPAGVLLEDREREHAEEMIDAAQTPLGVRLGDDLGV
jgi:hypothetical protein